MSDYISKSALIEELDKKKATDKKSEPMAEQNEN